MIAATTKAGKQVTIDNNTCCWTKQALQGQQPFIQGPQRPQHYYVASPYAQAPPHHSLKST